MAIPSGGAPVAEFDPKVVEELIAKHKDVLLDHIEAALGATLRALPPKDALSLRLLSNDTTREVLPPGASLDYAKALLAFMGQKPHRGHVVDSAVTPVALSVIEKEISAFYASEAVTEAIITGIMQEVRSAADMEGVVRQEIQENVDWLRHEFTTLTVESSFSIAGVLADATVTQIQAFLASSAGKAVIAGLSKAMATTAGKIALKQMLTLVVKKVMASAAIKTTIITIIKKVGVGVLIKTAVGKALVALLAAVGIAHVPVAWVILPLIAGFLAYEYFHFPEKLSKKLPAEIRAEMAMRFGPLNEQIAAAASRAIFGVLEREITKVRT